MKKILSHLILLFLMIHGNITYGFDTEGQMKVAIINECGQLLVEAGNKACDVLTDKLDERLEWSKAFLTSYVAGLTLGKDSAYYKEMETKLERIESEFDRKAGKNQVQKRLEALLKVALLKPQNSADEFVKILYHFVDQPREMAVDKKEIAGKNSFKLFRIWLFDILHERFKYETDVYGGYKSKLISVYSYNQRVRQYNRFVMCTHEPYQGIESEKALHDKAATLLSQGLEEDRKMDHNSLMQVFILNRVTKVQRNLDYMYSDSVFTFIESLYLKSMGLNPDDETTVYNFYSFYHNAQAQLKAIDNKRQIKDLGGKKEIERRVVEYKQKAEPYLDKIKTLNEQ